MRQNTIYDPLSAINLQFIVSWFFDNYNLCYDKAVLVKEGIEKAFAAALLIESYILWHATFMAIDSIRISRQYNLVGNAWVLNNIG
jgi:hypothetical protein